MKTVFHAKITFANGTKIHFRRTLQECVGLDNEALKEECRSAAAIVARSLKTVVRTIDFLKELKVAA